MNTTEHQELLQYLETNLPMVIEAIVTIVIGIFLAKLVRTTISKILKKAKIENCGN